MSENDQQRSGTLTFNVDSSLLFQLGEQLVTKPSVALAELVKNAYDADATHVKVSLEYVGEPGGTILIEDDGHGMTFEEIKSGWMTIATASKRDNPVSRYFCRNVTGAKGIGRFAARRLGRKLLLESVARKGDASKQAVRVVFDWEKFDLQRDLVSIPVEYSIHDVPVDTQTGVSLLIEKAHDAWTADEIQDLRSDLLVLQTPFPDLIVKSEITDDSGCLPDPGFDFSLEVSGDEALEEFSGGLSDAFLRGSWARLDGEIREDGSAFYEINIRENQERDTLIDATEDYSGLEGVRFRIYYFVYRADYLDHVEFGVREASRKGREEGGVKVYLHGFRVSPYGDEGNDWLQLDYFSTRNTNLAAEVDMNKQIMSLSKSLPRPFLLLPKNNQLFGAVVISVSEYSELQITASREGLIENETFHLLRRFIQRGIYWMTVKYAAVTEQRRSEERVRRHRVDSRETLREASKQVEQLQVRVNTEKTLPPKEVSRELKSLVETIAEATEQVEEELEEHISEVAILRLLASAGTMLVLMNHQLQALTGAVSQTEHDLIRLRPEIHDEAIDAYNDIIKQISEWHDMVKSQVSQLGFLLSADSRERKRRLALHEIVDTVSKSMAFYMNTYNVIFENNVPAGFRTPPLYQAEMYAILLNIFSNALKAVHGQHERRLAVEAERDKDVMILRMLDTGRGLPVSKRKKVFQPFETTSIPNPVLGVGTGLGLSVVRDILQQYNGEARFIDAPESWKTCIEITIPY